MPAMTSLVLAFALVAAPAAPPYPSPRNATVTERTKCDAGTVAAVDPVRGELRVTTAAGQVTFRIAADTQVLDAAGQPGPVTRLAAGDRVRVWYVVDGGARPVEIARE